MFPIFFLLNMSNSKGLCFPFFRQAHGQRPGIRLVSHEVCCWFQPKVVEFALLFHWTWERSQQKCWILPLFLPQCYPSNGWFYHKRNWDLNTKKSEFTVKKLWFAQTHVGFTINVGMNHQTLGCNKWGQYIYIYMCVYVCICISLGHDGTQNTN